MPYLQINDKQVQLRPGETRIGVGGQVEVRLPGPTTGAGPLLAIVEVGRDNHVAVRRATADAVVRVNGVLLGAEPTPLLHGDKIEVAGTELYYGDDRKGGSTQFITAANVPDMARLRVAVPPRATAITGGRVISLVDGREYTVGAGLVFGRDASCDVVIASSEVSRRHAEIVAGDAGYVVTDSSTNGLFVNGERVEGMQILGRADILRIGPEEFRFYADAAAPEAAASPPAQVGPAKSAPSSPPPGRPGAAGERPVGQPPIKEVETAGDTGEAEAVAAPSRAPRGAIATLVVVSGGVLKGEIYPVKSILAHLGRGEHNDVIIPEESISDSHAKLQRRDGVWYITDVGSTNGTYVAGRRITAEERLGQTAEIRLGGVKLSFEAVATEPSTGPRGATRELTGAAPPEAPRRAPPAPRPAVGVGERVAAPAQGRGGAAQPARREASIAARAGEGKAGTTSSESRTPWGWILLIAAVVAAVATFYFTKVR
jgi:pSer/pThr/pTyr-binding forkhead associated (FHA) protein